MDAAQIVTSEKFKELEAAKHLVDEKEYDGAWKIVDKMLEDDPNHVPALIMATSILEKSKRLPSAYQFASRVVDLAPNLSSAWLNFGRLSEELYFLKEAGVAYDRALDLCKREDQKATIYINMAALNTMQGRWAEGEKYARLALEIAPDSRKAMGNLGLACLGQQKWADGWVNYDAIIGSEYRKLIKYADEPLWDGKPGQTVMVYGEQGLGDELSFASMLPDALAVCKKVIVDCDHRLLGLFKRSFPKAVVYGNRWKKEMEVAAEDAQCNASIAIGQLGRYFRLKPDDFPGKPYLIPDPERKMMWRELFKTKRKPVIGIAWTGGIQQTAAKFRKWSLDEIKPIINAVDAHWVCLQYKDAEEEIKKSGLPIHQYKYATLTKDYDDTAALVAACDLVICMQTSVGHLAAAMGKEVWVFVSKLTQWRYAGTGEKILWYDSMKVWRPKEDGSWPIADAANILKLRYKR